MPPPPNCAPQALTPVSSTHSSPPSKRPGADPLSMPAPPNVPRKPPPAAMTPTYTPPDRGLSMLPAPGDDRGERLLFDPLLDPKTTKLSRQERQKPHYKKFAVKVCREAICGGSDGVVL